MTHRFIYLFISRLKSAVWSDYVIFGFVYRARIIGRVDPYNTSMSYTLNMNKNKKNFNAQLSSYIVSMCNRKFPGNLGFNI